MRMLKSVIVWLCLMLASAAYAATPAATDSSSDQSSDPLSSERIDALIGQLEDQHKRQELIDALKTLVAAQNQQESTADIERQDIKSAAADIVEGLSAQVSQLTASVTGLVESANALPDVAQSWWKDMRDPAKRERWLRIGLHLLIVLASGFGVAALAGAVIRYLRRRGENRAPSSLLSRVFLLLARFVVDLLPVLLFAIVSYAVLTLLNAERETRVIAISLIYASIISRVIIAVSGFLVAPDAPHLRLWRLQDESAQYIHQWIRRLSFVAVYGFLVLQAALLLGFGETPYQIMLRLLGLVVITLLLVLIAQNRHDVAKAIRRAPESTDGSDRLSPIRTGLSRVWHFIATLYLLMVYLIWVVHASDAVVLILKATLASIAIVLITALVFRGVNRLFDDGLRISSDLHSRFPGLQYRLNRYFPLLRKILKSALAIFAALLIGNAWGIDALHWFTEGSGRVLTVAILNIVLILAVAVVLWELASGSIERYLENAETTGSRRMPSARARTLLTVGRNALLVLLTLVATLMVLSELGINIAPLLAGAGVIGLAIGFGSQRLVQDVINGVFILFQDLMSVGDIVQLGDKSGVVEALSIRTVRLRDVSGTVHTIPFSAIESVSNLTREFSYYVFNLGVAYREDVDEVIDLIKKIGEELRADQALGPLIIEPIEVFGVDSLGDSAVMIKGRIKTRPVKQWQVGRGFNRLVKLRFDEAGIEIPFPHQTIYFGQDKLGTAPPAFIQLDALSRQAMTGKPDSAEHNKAPAAKPSDVPDPGDDSHDDK